MDNQSAQTQPSPIQNNNPINKSLIIPILTLLVGLLLGFFAFSILSFGKLSVPPWQKTQFDLPTPPPQPIDESKLPISLSLLANPIVYEWRGSIRGKITSKDEHIFTLTDEKGSSIQITDLPPYGSVFKTLFFNRVNDKEERTFLKDIPLGSILRGDFFIFKGGPNTPVGSVFVKEE